MLQNSEKNRIDILHFIAKAVRIILAARRDYLLWRRGKYTYLCDAFDDR